MRHSTHRPARLRALLATMLVSLAAAVGIIGPATAQTLPAGFQESIVFSGLTNPTTLQFAPDGRVFVAEKSGLIKVFDSLSATSPSVFADLRTQVHNFWDRGLLGLVLDPSFATSRPYVYVLYTRDAAIGGTAPRWGAANTSSDPCPTPPGPTADGCVVSGRLSQLTAAAAPGGYVMTGSERVLLDGWCQQYPSHSVGSLAFGADGALYVSGGDGASFNFADWGQDGNPLNPCGDPPVGVGGVQAPPLAQGGALRSQSLRWLSPSAPRVLNGAVLRLDPNTGAALTDNPLFGDADPIARRIVAHGLRNPFRLTVRPGTSEVWVGDVGWNTWEEINRIKDPRGPVLNFGWPCYEGAARQSGYDSANLDVCELLYADGPTAVTPPLFTYNHSAQVVAGETCPTGSSSISGLAFYTGGNYPAEYAGALFFADYSRDCIWVMRNPPTGPPGLVAAYGFNEGSGTSAADASGSANHGTLQGATWTTQGRFGSALVFNGTSSTVRVNDSGSLDLSAGMTLEAWVYPTAAVSTYRAVLHKQGDAYFLVAGLSGAATAGASVNGACCALASGGASLPVNTWTHLTTTYDGAQLRLYVNGALVSSIVAPGTLVASGGALEIGGNAYGHFFAGRIDEVRIYNRALSASEITTDMNTPVAAAGAPTIAPFVSGAQNPVELRIGPGGDLFYADFDGGTIRRIRYVGANRPPVAVIQATPTSGAAPLAVSFDARTSSDPDGDPITYSWDLNGDGVFGDSTAAQPTFTYTTAGSYTVRLRVTDSRGAATTTTATITAGTRPSATISQPATGTTWKVGDVIALAGQATDAEDGTLAPSRLSWKVILHHCPSTCHTHSLVDYIGVASATFVAPDHEYPSHLEIQLTATDSSGLTDTKSVLIYPQTVTLTFQSSPAGLQLVVGGTGATTPFTRTVIQGSTNSVSATSPQTLGANSYGFASWSDAGAQSHTVTASASATYTATYSSLGPPPLPGRVAAYGFNEGSGPSTADVSGNANHGTLQGATWTTQGRFGSALVFNGTSSTVRVNDSASLDFSTGMTLQAWVYPTTAVSTYRAVLHKQGDAYFLVAGLSGAATAGASVNGACCALASGGASLPVNTWTHLTTTYDGAQLRLYVNGGLVATTAAPGSLVASGGALEIGGNAYGHFFAGRIDEVRIYNRALSASEITTDMNNAVR